MSIAITSIPLARIDSSVSEIYYLDSGGMIHLP